MTSRLPFRLIFFCSTFVFLSVVPSTVWVTGTMTVKIFWDFGTPPRLQCANCISLVNTTNLQQWEEEDMECDRLPEKEIVVHPDYCMIYRVETTDPQKQLVIQMSYKNYTDQPPINTCHPITKHIVDFNINISAVRLPDTFKIIKKNLANLTTTGGLFCSCDTDFCNKFGTSPKLKNALENMNATANEVDIPFLPASKGVIGAIVAGLLFTAIACALISMYACFSYRKVNAEFRQLTVKEVRDFRKGVRNLSPSDLYANVYSRPFDPKFEIYRKSLDFNEEDILGSGQFGIVYKGLLTRKMEEDGRKEKQVVAIKTVTRDGGQIDVETFKSLLSEIKIMSYLAEDHHENIIEFLGAFTSNIKFRDALAVVEFCSNGDLLTHLRQRADPFQNLVIGNGYVPFKKPEISPMDIELLNFALGIANGMAYLTIKDVIHGDLAARNILLTENMTVKISDFGLSRQMLHYKNYFKATEVPLPFKWMSLESMTAAKFSIQSDVWSFGIVLYEIFSLGQIPYPGLVVDDEFVLRIARGYRMEAPDHSSAQMYELMMECWAEKPGDRPSFLDIYSRLEVMINETLNPPPVFSSSC